MTIEEFAKIINLDINITFSVKNNTWYCNFEGITGIKNTSSNIDWNVHGKGIEPTIALNNLIYQISNKEITHKYLVHDNQTRYFNVPKLRLYE